MEKDIIVSEKQAVFSKTIPFFALGAIGQQYSVGDNWRGQRRNVKVCLGAAQRLGQLR